MTESGSQKWIFVEADDIPERQRWTAAHELGHLIAEALPRIEYEASLLGELMEVHGGERLMRFGRCVLPANSAHASRASLRGPLTDADKLELDANHFAAELMMPYVGVKRMLGEGFGGAGLRTEADLDQFVRALVRRYHVSREAAERRVVKDLALTPLSRSPNRDLFGDQ